MHVLACSTISSCFSPLPSLTTLSSVLLHSLCSRLSLLSPPSSSSPFFIYLSQPLVASFPPGSPQVVFLVMAAAFLAVEIRELKAKFSDKKRKQWMVMREYITSDWNSIDVLNILILIIWEVCTSVFAHTRLLTNKRTHHIHTYIHTHTHTHTHTHKTKQSSVALFIQKLLR